MGVQDPLCNAAATETSGTGDHIPQGVPKVVSSEPVSARAAEQGSDRASSTHPRLLQSLVPCSQGNRGVEADHRSVLPQCLRALPELHYGDASVNPELDTSVGLARPSHKRLTNWLSVAEGFTAQQSPPAVQWLQVLGNLVFLEKLVPYGRIRIRPTQWQLRLQWSQSKEKSSKLFPLDLQSRLAILGTIDVEYYLYTDSSTQGWGAHLQV